MGRLGGVAEATTSGAGRAGGATGDVTPTPSDDARGDVCSATAAVTAFGERGGAFTGGASGAVEPAATESACSVTLAAAAALCFARRCSATFGAFGMTSVPVNGDGCCRTSVAAFAFAAVVAACPFSGVAAPSPSPS